MRQIVYNNIMELIKHNCSIKEDCKTGEKYTLYGARNNVILSTYSNKRKIELFVNNVLFASAKATINASGCQSENQHQMYNIEATLSDRALPFNVYENVNRKHIRGATPNQTIALQVAWWKSYETNQKMLSALGNSR